MDDNYTSCNYKQTPASVYAVCQLLDKLKQNNYNEHIYLSFKYLVHLENTFLICFNFSLTVLILLCFINQNNDVETSEVFLIHLGVFKVFWNF